MERTVSAAEANRKFSELLRGVRDGDSYVVTAHGKPVAKLVPVAESDAELLARQTTFRALIDRLASQPAMSGPRDWTREELYERKPWRDGPGLAEDDQTHEVSPRSTGRSD